MGRDLVEIGAEGSKNALSYRSQTQILRRHLYSEDLLWLETRRAAFGYGLGTGIQTRWPRFEGGQLLNARSPRWTTTVAWLLLEGGLNSSDCANTRSAGDRWWTLNVCSSTGIAGSGS
jgi:hypothetical protein